jgi:hypothetical protein
MVLEAGTGRRLKVRSEQKSDYQEPKEGKGDLGRDV